MTAVTRLSLQQAGQEGRTDLTGMEVHRDDVVGTGHGEHVGHQFRADRGSALVLLVLPAVRIDGYDCSDTLSGGDLARVDHYQQLHQVVVHLPATTLHNVDVLPSNAFADLNVGLAIRKLLGDHIGVVDPQPV